MNVVDRQRTLDLSAATQLKYVMFSSAQSLRWINTAIETSKSKDLERVTVKSWHVLVDCREWEDLDHTLAQLWTSRSIRPRIEFHRRGKMIGLAPKLLPQLTKSGAVDVFEHGQSE